MVAGQYVAFMLKDADVQEGDILTVTSGPGSFGYLLAQGVSSPRGHHTEVVLSQTTEDPTI